jgi:hypothetical protein
MVRLLASVPLLLVACGSGSPAVAPSSEPPALSTTASLAFVPATIAERIGGAELVVAIDLARIDLGHLLEDLPEPLACVRDLEASAGLVVVTKPFAVHATGLAEGPTLACLEAMLPVLGGRLTTAAAGNHELVLEDLRMKLRWDAGILAVSLLDGATSTAASASTQLRKLAAQVPAQAQFLALWTRLPERDVRDVVLWGRLDDDRAHLSARAVGTEPGAAMRWLRGFATGIGNAATSRGITVDDAWFDYTDAEPLATLELRIPLAALQP